MTLSGYLVVAVFLPLFPASMLFNRLFARVGNAWPRMALLLLWPQLGLLALALVEQPLPAWLSYWAVLTSALYAFRALTLRDLGLWTAHMATSAWSLLWVVAMFARDDTVLALQALGFSAPFVLLAWLIARLESAFGAAYAGSCGGLAQSMPRLSTLLVLGILAAVGTPLFPAFFTLLAAVAQSLSVVPAAALLLLLVWLLWAWSGAQMTRGMIVGQPIAEPAADLGIAAVVPPGILLLSLAVAGVVSLRYLV